MIQRIKKPHGYHGLGALVPEACSCTASCGAAVQTPGYQLTLKNKKKSQRKLMNVFHKAVSFTFQFGFKSNLKPTLLSLLCLEFVLGVCAWSLVPHCRARPCRARKTLDIMAKARKEKLLRSQNSWENRENLKPCALWHFVTLCTHMLPCSVPFWPELWPMAR